MAGLEIPPHLQKEIGTYLRQGRTARKLNLAIAAYRIGITIDRLEALELGGAATTDTEVARVLKTYGEARLDVIESLLLNYHLNADQPLERATAHLTVVK